MNMMDMLRAGRGVPGNQSADKNGFASRFGAMDQEDSGMPPAPEGEPEGERAEPGETDEMTAIESLAQDADFMNKLEGLVDLLKKQASRSDTASIGMGMMGTRKLPVMQ